MSCLGTSLEALSSFCAGTGLLVLTIGTLFQSRVSSLMSYYHCFQPSCLHVSLIWSDFPIVLYDYRASNRSYGSDRGNRSNFVQRFLLVRASIVSCSCLSSYHTHSDRSRSNGVMQPFRLLGWWKWMYHLSPYTYLESALLGQGESLITNFRTVY